MSVETLIEELGLAFLELVNARAADASAKEKARLLERAAESAKAALEIRSAAQEALDARRRSDTEPPP